ETEEHQRGGDHYTHVDIVGFVEVHRVEYAGNARHDEYVENIRAHHVPYRDIHVSAIRGYRRGGKFGERGADRNDGEADECLAQAHRQRNLFRAVHRKPPAEDESSDTYHDFD